MVILLGSLMTLTMPLSTNAATPTTQDTLCGAAIDLSVDSSKTCSDTKGSESHFQGILADAINVFSIVVGVIAVLMIIFGGFRYITSGGNQENVKTAKNAIIYAIIGLIIVALAQIIVKFVLNQTAKTTKTKKAGYYMVERWS